MRTADDGRELPVSRTSTLADRDPLTRAVMDRMLASVSARKFAQVGEPVGSAVEHASSSTSKTTASELLIERTRSALGELMSRRLDDERLAVMMLDELEIADRTHVVALGITTDCVKLALGLWEGLNGERDACADAARGSRRPRPGPKQAILFVIDGGKAVRRAIRDVFARAGASLPSRQDRNVCDLLLERDRDTVRAPHGR